MISGPPERVHNDASRESLAAVSLPDHFAVLLAMPIYVFRCENCGEKFERLQKLSDPDPDVCPNCGKHDTVHRQVTAPAFRLAGSGWYETDFKSDKEKKHNLAGDAAKPKEPSGDKPAEPPQPAEAPKPATPEEPATAAKAAKVDKPAKAAGD